VIERITKSLGIVMSVIPLDIQRRCEQRWAAKFGRQVPEHKRRGRSLPSGQRQDRGLSPTKPFSLRQEAGLKQNGA
jgi:hypothetical protein